MLLRHFWVQAFDLAQQTALCWRPLWTVRGKPLPLPAVKLRRIIANIGRKKQAKNLGCQDVVTVISNLDRMKVCGGGRVEEESRPVPHSMEIATIKRNPTAKLSGAEPSDSLS